MAIGDRLLLTATVLPENATNKNITWICSPENVLSISQGGEVTAIGPGHGSVVVSTADGGFSAICNITVKDSTVDVESITLEPEHIILEPGGITTVKATVLPENATDKTLTWDSSDRAVATVDQTGKVIANGPGVCVIIVTSADGRVKAGCSVTVNKAYVAVESLSLDPSSLELKVGESVTVNATVHPENATDKSLKWESVDKNVATVQQNGRVTGHSAGKTIIIVATSNGIIRYCPVTVTKATSDDSSFFATNSSAQSWASDTDGTYGTGFSTTTNNLAIGYYKHTSTSNPVAPNSNHIRIYKDSVLRIKHESGKKIKKIVILCAPDAGTTNYCSDMAGLEGVAGATADKSALTITWTGSASQVVLQANKSQVRMEKLSVELE